MYFIMTCINLGHNVFLFGISVAIKMGCLSELLLYEYCVGYKVILEYSVADIQFLIDFCFKDSILFLILAPLNPQIPQKYGLRDMFKVIHYT